jgi:hypothetical protein
MSVRNYSRRNRGIAMASSEWYSKLRDVIQVFGAKRRTRGLPRALVLGAARLLLALAVICGAVQSGARYFYCEAVGLSTSDPCAAVARAGGACPFETVRRQSIDCCSIVTLPSMPDGARARERTVAAAGVVEVLPAREYVASPFRVEGSPRRAFRIERPPRSGGELRTQLMVFLT